MRRMEFILALVVVATALSVARQVEAAVYPDFTKEPTPLGAGGGFDAIDPISPGNVWAAGSEWGGGADSFGFVVHRTSSGRWHRVDPPCLSSDWAAIDDVSGKDVWFAGSYLSSDGGDDGISVARYDHGAWQCYFFAGVYAQPATIGLRARADNVWIDGVSSAGHVFEHWNGSSWEQFGPASNGVQSMGSSGTSIYAGGVTQLGNLQIWRRDG
jgi:hypothetical protein